VAFGRQHAVLLARWIEMSIRGGEGQLALADRMDVKTSSPAGKPLTERLINTPDGVCVSCVVPTSLPSMLLSAALALCAAAGTDAMASSIATAMPTLMGLSSFHARPHAFAYSDQAYMFGARLYV
jgi:hypothetical protein